MIENASRFIGAYTGFAVGDAFGYPCRDMTYEQICKRFEKKGCLRLAVSNETDTALFTDATQMTLFTTDGLLWAELSDNDGNINYADYVFYAYQLWLYTQTKTVAGNEYAWIFDKSANHYRSKLVKTKGLYQQRFLDTVNVDVLSAIRNKRYGKVKSPKNAFDDSGGLKRILPAGLFFNYDTKTAFRAGADFAAITHGNPTAFLAAGFYAAVIAELVNDAVLDVAIEQAVNILKTYDGHEEVASTVRKVQDFLADKTPPHSAIERIGTDDNAACVLGIALFCAALFEDSFENAIRLAVNHDGLSDVCGALCGGLLGTYHGADFVVLKWKKKLGHLRLVEDMSLALCENTYFNEPEPEPEELPVKVSQPAKEPEDNTKEKSNFQVDFDDEYE